MDTHENVERFLAATDPALVNLCLDTGHIAYCGGDNLRLIQDHPDRIGYVHLKQVDPAVVDRVHAEGIGFGEAVRMGAMCEPPLGVPEMPPILDALSELDAARCSPSSSRTCTRARPTSPSRSPSAPTTTS